MNTLLQEYENWVSYEKPILAPDYARTTAILKYAKQFDINVFVETGTKSHRGSSTLFQRGAFHRIVRCLIQ